jgi:hypothetical protein
MHSGQRSVLLEEEFLVAHDVVRETSLWVGNFAAAVRIRGGRSSLRDRQLAPAHGGYDPTMACRIFGAAGTSDTRIAARSNARTP